MFFAFAAPMEEEDKKLSHRQKQRFVKREQKKVVQKAKLQEKRAKGKQTQQVRRKTAYNSDSEPEEEEEVQPQEASSDEEVPQLVPAPKTKKSAAPKGFTDDNDAWLKPKKQKKQLEPESEEDDEEEEALEEESDAELEEGSEDENGLEEEASGEEDEEEVSGEEDEEEESDDDTAQVGKLDDLSDGDANSDDDFDISGDEDAAEASSDDEDEDDDDDDDDDKLPIERANKKLKKREAKEAQLADEEMQMTVDRQDVFQLPNEEEEAEKDLTLQEVQQRIKDVTLVLSDFKKYRQADRSRGEYIDLLRRDLCLYYSYNEFLMEKLMDMFPLTELMEYLEASEVSYSNIHPNVRTSNLNRYILGGSSLDHSNQYSENPSPRSGRSSD